MSAAKRPRGIDIAARIEALADEGVFDRIEDLITLLEERHSPLLSPWKLRFHLAAIVHNSPKR